MKALQSLDSGITSLRKRNQLLNDGSGNFTSGSGHLPKAVKELFGFWAVTRQYFDDQARDFLRLMKSPSESGFYGYNQFELHSKQYVIPRLPDYNEI